MDARTSRAVRTRRASAPALADGDMPKLARRMYNVFEDVLTRREGEIAAIKSRLLDGGALGAVMSGTARPCSAFLPMPTARRMPSAGSRATMPSAF